MLEDIPKYPFDEMPKTIDIFNKLRRLAERMPKYDLEVCSDCDGYFDSVEIGHYCGPCQSCYEGVQFTDIPLIKAFRDDSRQNQTTGKEPC